MSLILKKYDCLVTRFFYVGVRLVRYIIAK